MNIPGTCPAHTKPIPPPHHQPTHSVLNGTFRAKVNTPDHYCFASKPACFISHQSLCNSQPFLFHFQSFCCSHSATATNALLSNSTNRCATSNHYCFASNHYCFTSHQSLCHFQTFLFHSQSFLLHFQSISVRFQSCLLHSPSSLCHFQSFLSHFQ